MKIVIAMTGATGAVYGIRLLDELKKRDIETHLVLSDWAKKTISCETDETAESVIARSSCSYEFNDLAAAISSGSFQHDGMVVAPCSMKTLAAIAAGYDDNLISRAADVTLKERRKLILLTRESPLTLIHLRNMTTVTEAGAIVFPPVPAFYSYPRTVDDIVDQSVARILDLLGIPNDLARRWPCP